MDIRIGDIHSVILHPRAHLEELEIVRQVCRARPDDYQFMPKYRMGYWDGWISLMNTINSFPTGLVPQVVEALEEENVKVNLVDQIPPPHRIITPDCLSGITLRDYQVEAANSLLDSCRGVAKMATNTGKTEVIAAMIRSFDDPYAVVMVSGKDLLYQTAKRLSDRLSRDVGIIGDGIWNDNRIVVAMVQTLYAALNKRNKSSKATFRFFPHNILLIVDECHHISSSSMLDVMSHIPGPYRFGLSGTPLKYDSLADMKLVGYTGDIIFEVTNDYMIRHGWSAKPIVQLYVIEADGYWDMDYFDAYANLIVKNDARNNIIADRVAKFDGVAMILVNQLEHGERLKKMIPNSIFINGSHSSGYRRSVLDSMRQSSKGIVIATAIFDEGIDVPSVDMVVLAGGGKGHVKLLQRIGRGMRRKASKNNKLIVIDFIDDTNQYLLDHSDERLMTYEEEGFHTEICH